MGVLYKNICFENGVISSHNLLRWFIYSRLLHIDLVRE